jgi:[ribosomal protein S5]-alanine N-acetyltransferase
VNIQLRPFNLNDAARLAELGNSLHIAKFMAGRFPFPYFEDDAVKFIMETIKKQPLQSYAITLNNNLIGACGVHPQEDIFKNNAEIGYWLGEEYWGKGYAGEALKILIPKAFTDFKVNRLYARVFGNNPRSMKLLEKSGFKLEARYEGTLEKFGEILDEYIYAYRKKD